MNSVTTRRRQALQQHADHAGTNPHEAATARKLLADLPPAEPEPYTYPITREDFTVPNTGGYGAARAKAIEAIARAHNCTARPPALPMILIHGAGSLRAPDRVLEIEGRRELVTYLLDRLPDLLAQADAAAKEARRGFRAWLRTRPDHEYGGPSGINRACRAWTKDFIAEWGRAYGLRILRTATRQLPATHGQPAPDDVPADVPGTYSAIRHGAAAAQEADITEAADTVRKVTALPWPVDPEATGRALTGRTGPLPIPAAPTGRA